MAKPLQGIILDAENPTDFIEFYSFDPPQYTRNPVYDDVNVRGRSEPHVFYSNTEAQIWSFSIHLADSYDQADSAIVQSAQEKKAFIESLVMPDYGSSAGEYAVVKPPHLARMSILKMFNAIGTIRGLSFTLLPPYHVEDDGKHKAGEPQRIDCSFSFHAQKVFGTAPSSFSDVRMLSYRGQDRFAGV